MSLGIGGSGDQSFHFQDPETGALYRVVYDFYTDPDAVVLERVWREGAPVKRLALELRRAIEAAAMDDYRSHMLALRDQAARSK